MKIRHFVPVMVLSVIVSGCSFIPKYTRPSSRVPVALPAGPASGAGVLAADALKWERVFPDEKLQKIIVIALSNNMDLKIAILNVERMRSLYGIQQARLYPALTGSASGSTQHVPADLSASGKKMSYDQYSVNLGIVSWEVDLFGRIRSLKEQALEEYLGTEQARRGAQVAVIGEVARAYYTLAADLENLKLAQATLETQRSVYGVIYQRFDKGLASETDLRRSQTQVDTAVRDIAYYSEFVMQDRNALDLLAGSEVPDDLLPSDLEGIASPKDISPGLSSAVLLRRPDIMEAEHRLKAANAYIGAARAAFFPQISITTLTGAASSEFKGLFKSGSNAWSFAPQAAMPLFDMRVQAAYRASESERDIAVAQYQKSIQTAFREVSDALAARSTLDEQVSAQESIVDSEQIIYELSNKRYTQGIDDYLSVLDAQRSLYTAQKILTGLRYSKLANQVGLYTALGGDM